MSPNAEGVCFIDREGDQLVAEEFTRRRDPPSELTKMSIVGAVL